MSKRILVVEDQPDNRQIIRDMLAPTDYETVRARIDRHQLLHCICRLGTELTSDHGCKCSRTQRMVGIAADQVRVVHNLKTSKTLGIKISDDLLSLARRSN